MKACIAALAVCAFGIVNAAPAFTVISLPPTVGSLPPTFIASLNNQGTVVGASLSPTGGTKAYSFASSVATNLGSLPGGIFSGAVKINDAGKAVGYSQSSLNPQVAVLFDAGTVISLGTLGGTQSRAASINQSGIIVGWADTLSSGPRAFAFSGGVMTSLGTLGGFSSQATDINAAGGIVGTSSLANGLNRAFVYVAGSMIDLGTLGGPSSSALAINNFGTVVGRSTDAVGRPRSFTLQAGAMRDLGDLGGDETYVSDINDLGWTIGVSRNGTGSFRPFLETAGFMVDINDLIDPLSGWTILEANGINESGTIAGYGCNTMGDCRGLLLSPVPEPNSLLLLAAGALSVFFTLRKRKVKLVGTNSEA